MARKRSSIDIRKLHGLCIYDIDVSEYGYDPEKRRKKIVCFDTLMRLSVCYEDHGNPIDADIQIDSVLDVLYEQMKVIENIIISLIYAAETNKWKNELKSTLQLVKTYLMKSMK